MTSPQSQSHSHSQSHSGTAMMLLGTLGRAVLLAGATLWFAAGTVWAFYLPLPSSPKPRPTPPAATSPRPSAPARPPTARSAMPGALHPALTATATPLQPILPPPIGASPIRAAAMSPVLPTTATATATATARVANHPPSRPKPRPAHSPRR